MERGGKHTVGLFNPLQQFPGRPASTKMYGMFRQKDERAKKLIESIREQCLRKGLSGIKGLGVLFRGMDKDFSKAVVLPEFVEGIRQYGIHLTDDELVFVFMHLDVDHSGTIDFGEFLLQLMPPMCAGRVAVVNEAFDRLDAVSDGVLRLNDLMISYKTNAEKHPKYLSGQWTLEQVLQHFLDTFDSKEGEEKDGVVTREEFLNYYAAISCTIEDDAYFDLMMRSSWGLPPKTSASRSASRQNLLEK